MKKLPLTFGQRVQAFRKSRGYSRHMLAGLSGLHINSIQRVEAGTTLPRMGSLESLARALGVTPAALLGGGK